ncbi:MAG: hypothetical protein HYR86_15010 [Candidatus Rokubacteria bacterium]|nr:hypothetical protein [Candidatus Rokubacteria bacterium]
MSRHIRGVVSGCLIGLAAAAPASADDRTTASTRPPAGDRPSLSTVVRKLTEYRTSLDRLRAAADRQLAAATDALEEKQDLHHYNVIGLEQLQESERAWSAARRQVDEVAAWIAEADSILGEAALWQQVARIAPLRLGAYEESATLIRFNGTAKWSLRVVDALQQAFSAIFNRALPLSAVGQTAVHDRIGLDHREAADVALHPDSPEGRWLMEYLRRAQVPFIAVRGAIAGSSTGAHVHIGRPSPRFAGR